MPAAPWPPDATSSGWSHEMQIRHFVSTVALLALGAQTLSAQQARSVTPAFAITVGSMSIESASATSSQVGDRSYGLEFDAGALVKRHFYFGMDIGGQFLD